MESKGDSYFQKEKHIKNDIGVTFGKLREYKLELGQLEQLEEIENTHTSISLKVKSSMNQ